MKEAFYNLLEGLLSDKDSTSSRNFIIGGQRYEDTIKEVQEAKEKRRKGQTLTSKEYRRIRRFDVVNMGDKEILIEKTRDEMSNIKYFCRINEMYDAIHSAHLRVGHKKEKAMEAELKKKYCNITREVIKIYLDTCELCSLKKKTKTKGLVVNPFIMSAFKSQYQVSEEGEREEFEGQQKKSDKCSEKSVDSYSEDGPSAGMDEGDQYFVPETTFVPVGVIKEEPVELEESECFNTYSEYLSLNLFPNKLNLKSSDLMSETFLETAPPVSSSTVVCENPSPLGQLAYDQLCEKTRTETHNDQPPNEASTRGDDYVDPCINENLSEVQKVINGSDNDFTNLKNVVYKLEKISDQLACAAKADQYEQFGKYLAILLRGIPQKKFLSLKKKFISDVIQTKMALDEFNGPATGNCTVPQTLEPPEGSMVDINTHHRNPYQSTSTKRFCSNSDTVDSSGQRMITACTDAGESGTSELPSVLPMSTPSTNIAPVLLSESEGNGTSRSSSSTSNSCLKRPGKLTSSKKRLKKALTEHVQDQPKHTMEEPAPQPMEDDPLRCTEDKFEIEIEEGTELKDIKPNIFDTFTSDDHRTEHGTVISQETGRAIKTCKESLSGLSGLPIEGSSFHFTPRPTCNKCNLDLNTSIDIKRHFMISHPGEIPMFKKTCSAGNQNSSKIHSQEMLSTSVSTLTEQIVIHGKQGHFKKSKCGMSSKRNREASVSRIGDNHQVVHQQPAQANARVRCTTCPRNKDIKTKFKCDQCHVPMCHNHMKHVCEQCLAGLINEQSSE